MVVYPKSVDIYTDIGKKAFLSYSQAEPGRELTQPSPRLLAEPCRVGWRGVKTEGWREGGGALKAAITRTSWEKEGVGSLGWWGTWR